jgi:predicted transposase YbfD/YdcC
MALLTPVPHNIPEPGATVLSIAVPAVLCGADAPTSIRYWADGKTLKTRRNESRGPGPRHLVGVWMSERGTTLAQLPTEAKSNEITAIPKVLQLIDVRGAIITLDAMGAQNAIVKEIVDRNGDVIICLKGSQGKLYNSVADFVERHTDTATKKRHGRLESRTYIHLEIPKEFPLDEKWIGIKSVGVVIREAGNPAWIRRFTLALLKPCPDRNSVAGRRRQCGWSEEFLTQVPVRIGT